MKIRAFFIIAGLLLLSIITWGKDIPPVPNPPRLVNDFAGVLNENEVNTLERKLDTFNDSTSTQISVVIEKSLEGEEVFDYSIKLAEAWGIGQKGKNNGILIYVAINEHKIQLQVGYGLEGVVTDAQSKRIIEDLIKPNFKQGYYYGGLDAAIDRIISLTKGEYKSDVAPQQGRKKGISWIYIVLGIILLLFLFRRKNNNNYGSRSVSPWTAFLLGSALGGSSGRRSGGGWGDFSSGGGSFGGFGGGGFGGGGAGGSW